MRDGLYLDGEWRAAADGAAFDLINPATGSLITTIPSAAPEDVDRALDSAQRGFDRWRASSPAERSRILNRAADLLRDRTEEIAATLTEEQGKPIAEARAEIEQSAAYFEFYGAECLRDYGRIIPAAPGNRQEVTRYPVGPVAAFTAWNFPLSLPARKVAPALAAGCSVILKPAELAPRTAMRLIEACHDAGVPPGVLNLLTGDPDVISKRLCTSGVIRKITLTGSVEVGRTLIGLSAQHIVPISLELGGHAPVLVFADTDIDGVAAACVRAKFRNAGQVCISPSRFYVESPAYEEFRDAFVRHTRELVVGPPTDPAVQVGPLSSERRLQAAERIVSDARDLGAAVETGGRRQPGLPDGYFFEPTVLTGVTPEMAVMRDEPFSPIAPIASFDGLGDGLAKANSTPFGLAAYVFTASLATAHTATAGIEAGMVGVNQLSLATASAPFGGTGLSGYGREGGLEGLHHYTYPRAVSIGWDSVEVQPTAHRFPEEN